MNIEQAVQIIVLTIHDRQFLFLGPVVHAPLSGLEIDTVQSIEFGEVIPISLASKVLSGDLSSVINQNSPHGIQ